MNGASLRGAGRELVAVVRREQLTFLAAAIAYYAFVSIVPLVMIGLAVATILGGEALAADLTAALEGVLTPDAAGLVGESLTAGAGRGGATLVGLLVLAWSGMRLFRGLDVAFARIYGSSGPPSLLAQVRDASITLFAIGIGVIATVGLSAVLPLAQLPLRSVIEPLLLVLVLSVLFLPLYAVLPAPELRVIEVVPGAVLAGGGWALLAMLFEVYAEIAGAGQVYGLLGGVLLVLTWLYVGSLVILLGAALNATLAGRRRDRQLQQEPGRRSARPTTMSGREDGADAEDGPAAESTSDGPTADDEPGPPLSDGGRAVGGDATDGSDPDAGTPTGSGADSADADPADVSPMDVETADPEEVERLRRRVEEFEADIEDRTVHRDDLESDLRRYVRGRMRRGHARGWGPYLVLLYGTAMTLGAFYYLEGVWAVLAMFVIWLSTLGLYALMLIVGLTATVVGLPRRLLDRVRDLR